MPQSKITEARALLRIAAPLLVAYLADILTVVVAKATIGKLGFRQLAAAGVAADLSFTLAIVVMGYFSVVGVLASGALGANRREDVLPALFQGLWMAVLAGTGLTAIVLNLPAILGLLGQDPGIVALSEPFSQTFAFAMLPLVMFALLRSFAAALNRTGAVFVITATMFALTFIVMPGLTHGAYGLPRLGMMGAGIAWSLLAWFKCLALAGVTIVTVWRARLPWAADWLARSLRPLPFIRLGLPVAGIVALESALFATMSLLSGVLGDQALAAYQMMMGWIAIPFVISLGLAEATMVRVAYWRGAGDGAATRRAGNLGMAIGVAMPLVLVVIPVAAPQLVTRLFLSPTDQGFAVMTALAAKLLFIGAIFQVFDGLQAIASHALRGLHDAAVPLVIATVGYWVVGLGAAYLLAFVLDFGEAGLVWGLALGLAFVGSLLALRFERLARRAVG